MRKDPGAGPGPAPLSEPGIALSARATAQFRPQLVVSIHAPYGVPDFDGPA